MKIFIAFFMIFFVTACSSPAKKSSRLSSHDEIFKMSMRIGCNMKYPDSKEMCRCHADTLYEVTPPDVRASIGTDPSAKMKLLSIMLENSEKLNACGKRPSTKTIAKKAAPTSCYTGIKKPDYYLSESQSVNNSKTLSNEELQLIHSVESTVSKEELKKVFYSPMTEKMSEYGNILDSKLKTGKENSQINIKHILAKTTNKTIACTDKVMHLFYSESEVDTLYKLNYAGYPLAKSKETVFQLGLDRRAMSGISEGMQRTEMQKYMKCEIRKCMN